MRTRLAALALLACLAAPPALAGETFVGKIVSAAGADTTNATTSTPFFVPAGTKFTMYCSAAAYVCVDTASACTDTAGATPGVPVAALTVFPTSTSVAGGPVVPAGTAAARGSYLRIVGAGAVTCTVWVRQGTE